MAGYSVLQNFRRNLTRFRVLRFSLNIGFEAASSRANAGFCRFPCYGQLPDCLNFCSSESTRSLSRTRIAINRTSSHSSYSISCSRGLSERTGFESGLIHAVGGLESMFSLVGTATPPEVIWRRLEVDERVGDSCNTFTRERQAKSEQASRRFTSLSTRKRCELALWRHTAYHSNRYLIAGTTTFLFRLLNSLASRG